MISFVKCKLHNLQEFQSLVGSVLSMFYFFFLMKKFSFRISKLTGFFFNGKW